MAQFKNDKEKAAFCREWEKLRREILELTKGRTIILVSEERGLENGFINRSRSNTGNKKF